MRQNDVLLMEPLNTGQSSRPAQVDSTPSAKAASLLSSVQSPSIRLATGFLLLGTTNNALYVVILTAALELIPRGTPTGVVAFANIAPALVAKAVWPYVLKGQVRYTLRVWSCVALSLAGIMVSLACSEGEECLSHWSNSPTDRRLPALLVDKITWHLDCLFLFWTRRIDLPPTLYSVWTHWSWKRCRLVLQWHRSCWAYWIGCLVAC